MKRLVHIAARILTAYFIALPILFGYHAVQHQHDCIEDNSDGLEYIKFTPDCALCDLYHSQTAILGVPVFYLVDLHLVSTQSVFKKHLAEASKHLHFLRGPPTV